MTDKVQKIREKVERLKSQLFRGACSSQIAMETRCKEEAYNEVLAILDTMQEEHNFKVGDKLRHKTLKVEGSITNISENGSIDVNCGVYEEFDIKVNEWELVEECNITGIKSKHATGMLKECIDNQTEEGLEQARKQLEEEPVSEQNLSNVERIGKDWKEEPVSEDFKKFEEQYLEKEKDEIISVYDRHAGLVDGAQWQKKQFEKNRLAACDRQTEEEAEMERGFCMGIIENEHRQPTFDDAIKYGMRLQKKQMMAKAINAQCFGFQDAALFSFRLPVGNYLVGSEVKVIVIKEG